MQAIDLKIYSKKSLFSQGYNDQFNKIMSNLDYLKKIMFYYTKDNTINSINCTYKF